MSVYTPDLESTEIIHADSKLQMMHRVVRAALAPLLMVAACSSSSKVAEDPVVQVSDIVTDGQSAPPIPKKKEIPAENRAILEGQPFKITIPAGDNLEKALLDFQHLCDSYGVRCTLDEKDVHYQQLCDKSSLYCSPENKKKGGDFRRIERHEFMCRPDESYEMTLVYKNGRIEVQKVPQYLNPLIGAYLDTLSCSDSPPLSSSITINELLRAIIKQPWLLETLKNNKLPATGSTAKAWLPKSEIPSDQKVGYHIQGRLGWAMIDDLECQTDCKTGEHTCERIPQPVSFFVGADGGTHLWDRDIGVAIMWDGKKYRITYESYCF